MFDTGPLLDLATSMAVVDCGGLSDVELMDASVVLRRVDSLLAAARGHALAEVDVREVSDRECGMRTAAWVAREAECSAPSVRRDLRVAKRLRTALREVDEAVASGELSMDHARVIAEATNSRNVDGMELMQAAMIESSKGTVFDTWRRDIAALAAMLDEDGPEPPDDLSKNRLELGDGLDGFGFLRGSFTPELWPPLQQCLNDRADVLFRRFREAHKLDPDVEVPTRSVLLALALAELVRDGTGIDLNCSREPRTELTLVLRAGDLPDVPSTAANADPTDGDTSDSVDGDTTDPRTTGTDVTDADTSDAATSDADTTGADTTDTRDASDVGDVGEHDRPSGADDDDRSGDDETVPRGCAPDIDDEDESWSGAGCGSRVGRELGISALDQLARSLVFGPGRGGAVVTGRNGVPLPDRILRYLLQDPDIYATIVDSLGVPLDMGRKIRLANQAQRRAMAVRDGGCVMPGCDRPINWTHAHHRIFWENDGKTDLRLLASACGFCHGVFHRNGWKLHATDDGWFWVQTPSGKTFWCQRHFKRRTDPPPPPV